MIRTIRCFVLVAALLLAAFPVHASWPTQGLLVGESAGVQAWCSLTSDNAGGALVSWVSPTGTSSTLFLQHFDRDGVVRPNWPATGLPVCTLPYQLDDPRYRPSILGAPDGTGGVYLLWTTLDVDQNIEFRLIRITGSGVLGAGWPAAGLLVKGGPIYKRDPALAADGKSGALVAWSDLEDGNLHVCVQRYTATATIAASWPAVGVRPSQGLAQEMRPVLCADASGGAWVGWIQEAGFSAGAHTSALEYERILHHIHFGGTLDAAIPSGGIHLSGDDPYAALGLVYDAAGGAFAAWRGRSLAGQTGFMVQHIAANGGIAPGWPTDGVRWSDGFFGEERNASGDGFTGILLCGGSYDVATSQVLLSTQRLLENGTSPAGWPSSGVLLGPMDTNNGAPYSVSDGAGGSITVWPDTAADQSSIDLFSRRVAADGSVVPPMGHPPLAVCAAPGMQGWFTCHDDDAGGVFVLWTDQRSDGGDVYLRRVTQADLTGVPPPSTGPTTLSLGAPRPNPSTSVVVVPLETALGGPLSGAILDLFGRQRRKLLSSGNEFRWDGLDDAGRDAGPGIYWLIVHAGSETKSVRLLRL